MSKEEDVRMKAEKDAREKAKKCIWWHHLYFGYACYHQPEYSRDMDFYGFPPQCNGICKNYEEKKGNL